MNKLFYGDNPDILRKFIRDEIIDPCYIELPFIEVEQFDIIEQL
ncbi:MAG: hypothetical protein ACR2MG_15745 [Pyrinomonadaceae bacterium]